MSKKKTTMTLKDFHGGSIPSDLHLPSAPGVPVRPPDRPAPWGRIAAAAGGRTDHHLRPRPGSAGGAGGGGRGLDERAPVLLSHIGRHFDEDERKPFDASSAPRRAPATDSVRLHPPPLQAAPAARSEVKRPITSPVTYPPADSGFPTAVDKASTASPNAWGVKKEVAFEPTPAPAPSPAYQTATSWSAFRLAQASAVKKVTSGRWQSKPPEVEVIRFHETEGLERRFYEGLRVVNDGDHKNYESERPKSVSSIAYGEAKERTLPGFYSDRPRDQERRRISAYPESKVRNVAASFYNGSVRPASAEGRFGGSKLQRQGMFEVSERAKLTLLPTTKLRESSDPQSRALDDKQAYQSPVSSVQVRTVHETHENLNSPRPGLLTADEGSRSVERPRLNLKPRTQPVEQPDKNNDRERQTLFGGARPRELVLKERGIDIAAKDIDINEQSNRSRTDLPKIDPKLEPAANTKPGERVDGFPQGQRNGRDIERKGYRLEAEKEDAQNTLWRNNKRRNTREIEKPVEHPRAEPDTRRKPVEQPKPDAPGPGPRFGKALSASELAQAFSPQVSDAKSENQLTNQKSLRGISQAPFSRLTDSRELYSLPAQRQINGY